MIAQIPGMYAAFLPGNNSFIAYSLEQPNTFSGNCTGKDFSGNTLDGEALILPDVSITINSSGLTSEISPNPEEQFILSTGQPIGDQLFIISGGVTRLFDGDGQELALLNGKIDLVELMFSGVGSGTALAEEDGTWSFLSADGQRIVTYDAEQSYLYDASGQLIAELDGTDPQFDPTGRFILTRTINTVYLYDRSGHPITEFEAGEQIVFSPDGERIAIAYRIKPR